MNYKKSRQSRTLALALLTLGATSGVHAADEAVIQQSFYPYQNDKPSFAGLSAGMTINKGNVAQFKEILDPAFYGFIEKGWAELKVGDTTSFDLHPNYVEATRQHMDTVKLGAKPGEISGAVAGRPFPQEPDANDPRAGEKLAWNYKYGYNWGDSAAISPFYWKFRDMNTGKLERTIKFDFHFLNFTRRVNQEPTPAITPNPSQLFRGIYVKVQEPYDVRNTQLLIHRAEDDLKRDNSWLYLGFQRRVRRLATGQVTDAFLGSDLMIEDFEGYNGRVSDMKWTFKGTKNVMLPMWNHNELKLASDMPADADGFKYVDFGGQGKCFHEGTWQLRKVYVLEAAPVNPNHPVSKRVFYMDVQLGNLNGANEIYDRKGELWKVFMVGKSHADQHLPINKGAGIGVDDAFSMVDLQSRHCTTGQFKGQVDPKKNPPGLFQVQNLRGGD